MAAVELSVASPAPVEPLGPGRTRSLEALHEVVRRSNPTLDPSTTTYHAAVLLLAAAHVGQNVDKLSRFTGYPEEFVARCARRLYDNGVWKCGRTEHGWYLRPDREDGFWADVAVAEGRLGRRIDDTGVLHWFAIGTRHEVAVPPAPPPGAEAAPPNEAALTATGRPIKPDLFPDAVWLT